MKRMMSDHNYRSLTDDSSENVVWCKGDHCLSPWSGDGKEYYGIIRSLRRVSESLVLALVKFEGYDSEDNEEMDVQLLKKPKCNSSASANQEKPCGLFAPLTGHEEEQRIRDKYAGLEEDTDSKEAHQQQGKTVRSRQVWMLIEKKNSSPTRTKKEKLALVTADGGNTPDRKLETIPAERKQCDLKPRKPVKGLESIMRTSTSKLSKPSVSGGARNNEKINSIKGITGFDGFVEDDMEKPQFRFPAVSAKIPFVLSSHGKQVVQVPGPMNQYLRDYQREGIRFLYEQYKLDRGAILGDDMGLGKTVQVIALFAALLRKQGNKVDVWKQRPQFIRKMSSFSEDEEEKVKESHKPFLVICPGTVLYNWLDEFETWGYFTVGKYHGSDKQQCLADVTKGKLEVVVTTFETFRDHVDDINTVDWAAVIADEVHRIKGLKAQLTQALRMIPTKRRFGLTGTALQNNMTELWSIFDWAQPGYLESLSLFEEKFVHVIERGQMHNATKRELAEARKNALKNDLFGTSLKSTATFSEKELFSTLRQKIMLRRTKSIISIQLPKKDDNVVFCKLTDLQISIYKTILDHKDMQHVLHMSDPCSCESQLPQGRCCCKVSRSGQSLKSLMFQFLHLFLKVANHVALLLPNQQTREQSEHCRKICEHIFSKHPHFLQLSKEASFRTLSDPCYCGKMKVLEGLLSVFYKTHCKVLLFSYSTRILDILEQYMMTTSYEYRRLDGKTSCRMRLEIVREFNRDPNIFLCLISTKAGGIGLNMTGANVVIIFDPNWNPSHDLQAQDRAYRIGQRRNVRVFRLISAGTIEENIYLRQVYKQQLDNVAVSTTNAKRYFHGIQGDRHCKGELFGVKNMFRLRTGESCLTMDILQRNEKLEENLSGYNIVRYESSSEKKEEDDIMTDFERTNSSECELDFDEWFPPLVDDNTSCESSIGRGGKSSKNMNTHREKRATETSTDELSGHTNGKERDRSFSSVSDVFAKCGVLHVHENRKVTGGSRAEDHMTHCAMEDVFQLNQNSQLPAVLCAPYSQSDSDRKDAKQQLKKHKQFPDHNTPRILSVGANRVMLGQTPRAIKRQQFKELAEHLGLNSPVALADKVISGSVEERLQLLASFYSSQNTELAKIFEMLPASGTTSRKEVKRNNSTKDQFTILPDHRQEVTARHQRKLKARKCEGKSSPESYSEDFKLTVGNTQKKRMHHMKTRKRTCKKYSKGVQWSTEQKVCSKSTPNRINDIAYAPHNKKDDECSSVSFDALLDEMNTAGKLKNKEHQPLVIKPETESNLFSELDDIFLSHGITSDKKRKAPRSTQNPCQESSKTSLMSGRLNRGSDDLTDLDDIINCSTLQNSYVDCFKDSRMSKEKTIKRKINIEINSNLKVDKIITETDAGYKNLFSTGRRAKLKRSGVATDKRNYCAVSPSDGTPSLF